MSKNKEVRPIAPVSMEKRAEMSESLALSKLGTMSPHMRAAVAHEFLVTYGEDAFTKQALWDYAPKSSLGPRFVDGMKTRRTMLKEAGSLDPVAVDEFARSMKGHAPLQVAKALVAFDKLAGLNYKYKDGLDDAFVTCFAGEPLPTTTKLAAAQKLAASLDLGGEDTDLVESLRLLEKNYPRTSSKFEKMAEMVRANLARLETTMSEPMHKAARMYFGVHKYAELDTEFDGCQSEMDAELATAERKRKENENKNGTPKKRDK
jgi:hypothetical protein